MAPPESRFREPEVTIVVPTRDRAPYLRDCLRALAEQRARAAFEVVVVDNGSRDDTPGVVEEWARRDWRFRGTAEPQPGLSRAKNAGVRMARGRLLLFTDDDALPAPGWVDSYLDLFEGMQDEPVVAGGPVVPTPEDLGPWPPWFRASQLPDLGLLDHGALRVLGRGEYVWGGNMGIPAATFRRLGGWDESVGRRADERGTFEDAEYQDRVRRAGGRVWFSPSPSVRHRIPRRVITPRRVLGTAFARGRNELAGEALSGSLPQPAGAGAAAQLGSSLWRWLWSTATFRASSDPAAMERARRAAYEAGWSLDAFRWGRGSAPMSRIAARLAFGVRGVTLRLAPPEPPP